MADEIVESYGFVYVKVGDQLSDRGIKHGMVVCYTDPAEYNPIISAHTKTVFAVLKVPAAWKDGILSTPTDEAHVKRFWIDLDELEILTGRTGLVDSLFSKNPVNIIDCMDLSPTIFRSTIVYNYDRPIINDVNAVSSGSYTVGSGGDYIAMSLAFADTANLTGNLTFTQISDITETASASVTEDLGGYTFTVTNNVELKGDLNNRFKLRLLHTTDGFDIQCEGPGVFDFGLLNIQSVSNSQLNTMFRIRSVTTEFTCNIHDNLFDGNSKVYTILNINEATPLINIKNNYFWENKGTFDMVNTPAINSASRIENNVFYNSSYINLDLTSQLVTLKNNVFIDGAVSDLAGVSNAIAFMNATSDATGEDSDFGVGINNKTNIVSVDEFISLDDTSPDFLKLKEAATIRNAGIKPSIITNTTGIRGNNRPHTI